MKKNHRILNLGTAFGLALGLTFLTGCGQTSDPIAAESTAITEEFTLAETTKTVTVSENTEKSEGGVLFLKVNPEIAITYDAEGKVTNVEARNDDGSKIIKDYTGFIGKETKKVVSELVTKIGDAGYFVEEIEGNTRKIVIEVENGSKLPSEAFLDEVVAEVKACVDAHDWKNPINYDGTDYGVTNYDATDYGTVTKPTTPAVKPAAPASAPAPAPTPAPTPKATTEATDYGITDYNDTDYGPDNDGVTDYDDGKTDYNDSVTNYDDGKTDYDDGKTDYDDSETDYDDGKSDYDD